MNKGASKPLIFLAVCASALSGVGAYAWHEWKRPPILEIYVFDLPGSPAVLIRTPDDKRILVDGGSNSDVVRGLTGVLPFYSRRIDAVIVTVADGKHTTGLIDVLNRYDVGKIIIPAITLESLGLASSTDEIYKTFLETIDQKGIPPEYALAGRRFTLDQAGVDSLASSTVMSILFPVPADDFKYSKASGPETLFRIDHGSSSVVFTGGATSKIQKYIAANLMPADVLVVSNNPTASNLSLGLVNAIAPDYIVYSKTITTKPPAAFSAKTKPKPDPLAGILADHRFNIKETGGVKIKSDGSDVKVENIR